jgi:hypothetical protein
MFGNRYFAPRYFADRYFGQGGAAGASAGAPVFRSGIISAGRDRSRIISGG